ADWRAPIATFAPAAANLVAAARPRPELPPVTTATRPSSPLGGAGSTVTVTSLRCQPGSTAADDRRDESTVDCPRTVTVPSIGRQDVKTSLTGRVRVPLRTRWSQGGRAPGPVALRAGAARSRPRQRGRPRAGPAGARRYRPGARSASARAARRG